MVEIVIAESAWSDLDSITDYIAQDSPRYDQEFGLDLFDRIQQLKKYGLLGRMVPEFKNQELRELIFGSYRIV